MRVSNMSGRTGRPVANQFNIDGAIVKTDGSGLAMSIEGRMFQSYQSNIALIEYGTGKVFLDPVYWDYSNTTMKYLGQFLGHNAKETRKRIKSGRYIFLDLN